MLLLLSLCTVEESKKGWNYFFCVACVTDCNLFCSFCYFFSVASVIDCNLFTVSIIFLGLLFAIFAISCD